MNRLLLAMAFLPTGLAKATGQRFTSLPASDPVGFFFEAMYQTGPYWRFIGLAQIAAAILLLIPGTTTIGALLAFPIVISIFLITWGIGFSGTVYITAGMLLSGIYLLSWDADRIWGASSHLVGKRQGPSLLEGANWIERWGWALGGTVGTGFFLTARGFLASSFLPVLFYMGLAAAGIVALGWIVSCGRSRAWSRGIAS